MNYIILGSRIRQQRKKMRLTQEQLAELVGISPSFMGHIERGSRVASLETVLAICRALQVTPNALLLDAADPLLASSLEALPTDTRAALQRVIASVFELAFIANSAQE